MILPRYSTRLDWQLSANALSRLLDEKRAAGKADSWIDLTVSNPTEAAIAYPDEAIARALAEALAPSLRYRPDPQGLPESRAAVAEYYRARGASVEPERILLCASTSEAYAFLFKLLCDPGDAVLVPAPSYPLLDFLAALESVRLVPYRLAYDDEWHVDLPSLEEAIAAAGAERVKAIVVVSPNNPTGSFLKRGERDRIVSLAKAHSLALIVDEVFSDYPLVEDRADQRIPTLVDESEVLTFCLSGLSKVVGLPQIKLGWIVAAGPDEQWRQALARLELVADTYLSVSAIAQLAAPALLALRPEIAGAISRRARENLAALAAALSQTACGLLRAEGGWYAVIRLPAIRSDEQWCSLLLDEDDVIVHPGYFFDFAREACLVVSLLPPPDRFREGIARIVRRVAAE